MGMLDNNRKFDFQIFYSSRFHQHSNRLLSLNFAGVVADVIILAAAMAIVYCCIQSHTEESTMSGVSQFAGNKCWEMLLGMDRRVMP